MTETTTGLQTVQAKSYRNLDFDTPFVLDALNILIGANGAGKSNLLEMLAFLPDALQYSLPEAFKHRRSATSVASVDREFPVDVELTWELPGSAALTRGLDLRYHLTLMIEDRGDFAVKREVLEEVKPRRPSEPGPYKYLDFAYGRGTATMWKDDRPRGLQPISDENGLNEDLKSGKKLALGALHSPTVYPVLEYVREQVIAWTFYNANDMAVRVIKREPTEIDPLQRVLAPNGRNLGMVLYNLIQADEGDFQDTLDRILRSLFDSHRSLKFPLVDSTHFELRWLLEHRKPLNFDQISDGAIRMLCWIAVLCNPRPPTLICIDEPELGVHPAWLPILADLIREAALHTQVIISTHSPELLDEFTAQADKVVVCSQDEQGQATFGRLDPEALQVWLDRYRLGRMFSSGHPELGGWPA